jgi:adenylylsulfate kinase
LRERFGKVEVLDWDIVRTNLSKGLGFSRKDRDTNILRIGFVAELLARNGVGVVVSAISPFKERRQQVRRNIGEDFIEVYVDAAIEVCPERDVKGIYKRLLPVRSSSSPASPILTSRRTPRSSTSRQMRRSPRRAPAGL